MMPPLFDYTEGQEALDEIMDLPPEQAHKKLTEILLAHWVTQIEGIATIIINDLNDDTYLGLESADQRVERTKRTIHHLLHSNLNFKPE